MVCGGYSNGSKATGSAEANPSGLPHCAKILLPKQRIWSLKYATSMLRYARVNQQVDQAAETELVAWIYTGNMRVNYL